MKSKQKINRKRAAQAKIVSWRQELLPSPAHIAEDVLLHMLLSITNSALTRTDNSEQQNI
jgi:hypothetical protein